METIVGRMKQTFSPKPKREAHDKLNIYTISQVFNQLVNFKQLVKSMQEFIGHDQLSKVDVVLDCVKLVIDNMLQAIMYDRHDFELQLHRIKEELGKLNINCTDVRVKSLKSRTRRLMEVDDPSVKLIHVIGKRFFVRFSFENQFVVMNDIESKWPCAISSMKCIVHVVN